MTIDMIKDKTIELNEAIQILNIAIGAYDLMKDWEISVPMGKADELMNAFMEAWSEVKEIVNED